MGLRFLQGCTICVAIFILENKVNKFNYFRINGFEDIGTKKFDEFIKEKDGESMEVKVACEEALNSIDDLQRIIDKVTESTNKKEQVELINDILDAREARNPKEVVTKTILSCSEFDALKKRIRKEIAEECRYNISETILSCSDTIYEGQYYTDSYFDRQKALVKIIGIIKGE